MRYLLAFFFVMMYVGDQLGLNVSLAPGVSTKNLVLYITLIGIAVNAAVMRDKRIELPSVVITFAILIFYAFLTWTAVAFIFSDTDYDIRASFIALKSSLLDQYLTFIIFFFSLASLKDAYWLLKVLIGVTIVGNVVTLIDTFDIPNLGILQNAGRKAGRFDGFIGQPNSYGQILVLFIAPTVAYYLNEHGKAKVFAGIGILAAAMALILTGSRGAWVGLLLGSIIVGISLRKALSARMLVRVGAISISIVVVVVVITFATGYSDIYLGSFEKFEGGANRATSGRVTIWTIALQAILDEPVSIITGHGYTAYETSRQFRMTTHNIYLTYLYDLGIIGLFLFVAIFARVLAAARSVMTTASDEGRRQLMALLFGLSAFLISIFFSEYHTSAYLLWAYLGVMMRVALLEKSDAGFSGFQAAHAQAIRRQIA